MYFGYVLNTILPERGLAYVLSFKRHPLRPGRIHLVESPEAYVIGSKVMNWATPIYRGPLYSWSCPLIFLYLSSSSMRRDAAEYRPGER